jgi:hypothetical protein
MRKWAVRIVCAACVVGIAATAGSARVVSHQASCPIAGQCGVNPQTGCPTLGPLQPKAPGKCVPIPVSTFWVSKPNPNGACSELIVQVEPPNGATQYEAVVYANIGLGTRWWSQPVVPSTGTGPGAGPGQTLTAGVTYTVPAGHYAWQVGDYSGCNPGMDWVGDGGWAVSTPPVKGHGTIHISGPTHNAFHTYFKETVSGSALGGANYVISGEQLSQAGGCASTYSVEAAKSDWHQWPTGTGHVRGSFSLVAKFYAQNHGSHAICSYLINRATNHTYAHAGHFWSNA